MRLIPKHAFVSLLSCLMVGLMVLSFASVRVAADPVRPFELRCGWFSNPTPANAFLNDRDGEWIIGIQGGYQAEGEWPGDFGRDRWIRTNAGDYGYGCACMKVRVNAKTRQILQIKTAYARPLNACRTDKFLKEPG